MSNQYQSKYTDKKVGPAQHLAEFMCIRIADKERKTLTYKFWNLPFWKPVFLNQLRAAQSLLKLYTPEAIMAALRVKKNIISLRAAWMDPFYQAEQNKLDANIVRANATISSSSETPPNSETEARPTFSTVKNPLKGL